MTTVQSEGAAGPDAVACAVLMCHAPIVIPEIAGARGAQCAATTRAMEEAARVVSAHRPDVVVCLSPHTPRHPRAWGVVDGATLAGTFARFGAGAVGVSLPASREAATRISAEAGALGLDVARLPAAPLDHGALVPLLFVERAGWQGPTVVIAFPVDHVPDDCSAMGKAIARAAAAAGERWAVVASGDMSHRLTPDAPAGYHPRATEFDRAVTDAVARGAYREAVEVDERLRDLAAEDVVDSLAVAASAIGWDARGQRLLSYEGPFGVGYLVAVLRQHDQRDGNDPGGNRLLTVAREAIAAHLAGTSLRTIAGGPGGAGVPSRGVFVTLWGRFPTGERTLRGCVGHVEPVHPSLEEEIAACAVAAATRDWRMNPIESAELPGLHLELSLLGSLEPIGSVDELDPARYGVMVTQGSRRGVLLPAVEGVERPDQQLAIAARKGGVDVRAPYEMRRFTVEKISELEKISE